MAENEFAGVEQPASGTSQLVPVASGAPSAIARRIAVSGSIQVAIFGHIIFCLYMKLNLFRND
jgi:hypothetical protein